MSSVLVPQDGWKRRFFSIWAGQAASIFGTAVTQFVLIWWVTSTTKSAAALTLVSLAGLLPQAIFGPLGGVVADRWNRKLIMMLADAISAICIVVLIVLFATGTIQLWHVITMMTIRSTMQAFQTPAAMSSTTFLVPPEWLVKASGLNQMVMSLVAVAAAPVGAVILSVVPLQWALMIDVVTAFTAVLIVSLFRIPQPPVDRENSKGFLHELVLGAKSVLDDHGIRNLFIIMVVIDALFIPLMSLLPLFIVKEFNGTAGHVAVFEAAAGAGMLLGSMLVVLIRYPKRVMPVVLALYSVSSLLAAVLGIVSSSLFWLLALVWGASSLVWMMANGPIMATIQRTVRAEFQGRVISLYTTVIGFAGPIGLAFLGFVAEGVGLRFVLVIAGLLAFGTALLGFASRSLRNLGDSSQN